MVLILIKKSQNVVLAHVASKKLHEIHYFLSRAQFLSCELAQAVRIL